MQESVSDGHELVLSERLGHNVSELLAGGTVANVNLLLLYTFTHEVILDVNVLGVAVLYWVLGKTNSGLVVLKDDSRSGLRILKVGEETTEPDSFLGSLWKCHVLGLGRRESHCGLLLGLPADRCAIDEEEITTCRTTIFNTTTPVGVRVANQGKGTRRTGESESMVTCREKIVN
jgi:hypothetical protein